MPAPIGEEVVIPAQEEIRLTYYHITDFHPEPGLPGSPLPISSKLVRAADLPDGTSIVQRNKDGTVAEFSASIADIRLANEAQCAALNAVLDTFQQIRDLKKHPVAVFMELINQGWCSLLKAEGTIK